MREGRTEPRAIAKRTEMGIRENILKEATAAAGSRIVTDVRLGLGYTSVLLDSGDMGLAYTWMSEQKTECTVFKGMRPLAGKPAGVVIELLNSKDLLAVTIGLAAANAVLNHRKQSYVEGDLTDVLNIGPSDRVAMIGAFLPVIRKLEQRVSELRVFERKANLVEGYHPADEAFEFLSQSTVALVTSTSILNSTVDALLEAAGGCREIVMLGASTPLCAAVFAGTPVTALSGVIAADRDAVARVISEGGGMKVFKEHVDKVTLRLTAPQSSFR